MVRDDISTVLYVNKHLVEAVKWQEHPDIAHDKVHLGGSLSLYWPHWGNEIRIPNNADEAAVHAAISKNLKKA